MNYQNIKQIVQELFRSNLNLYNKDYPLDETFPDFVNQGAKGSYFVASEEAIDTARNVAEGYWENRTEEEIERDERNDVTLSDYIDWCRSELEIWVEEKNNEEV